MAEIKIEKKKPVWPWIVLILVLAALLFYFWTQGNDDNDSQITTIENTDTSAVLHENGSAVFATHYL